MTPDPISEPVPAETIQAFLEALDEAGETLRELLDAEAPGDSPAIQYYLDGSVFIEVGYLMVEQLAPKFPGLFRVCYEEVYWPLFQQTRRGQVSWGEALAGLPEMFRDSAGLRVQQELFGETEADEE